MPPERDSGRGEACYKARVHMAASVAVRVAVREAVAVTARAQAAFGKRVRMCVNLRIRHVPPRPQRRIVR